MIAQTRAARQHLVGTILARHQVRSQSELLAHLARAGIEITQATLSRDLDELRAVKVRQGRMLVYALPGEGGDRTPRAAHQPEEVDGRLRRLCEELLITAVPSGNLVVARTPPGAANFLASAIDHADDFAIVGTIAGDDSILIITDSPRSGSALAERLLAMTGSGDE